MTKWYIGNDSGPKDWSGNKTDNPYGGYPYDFYPECNKSIKQNVDTLANFLNNAHVKSKITRGEKVVAKVKRGGKVYRMTIVEITPKKETNDKITIEIEDSSTGGDSKGYIGD
tara:strand:- start:120 stop:458 length:339 start_codon:yes stop_codon:yes gene_type:complete